MAIISFTKFDLGIDHRKGPTVSDANRLQELKNGYVTTGLAISKRQGLTKIGDLTPGTRGLFSYEGKLHTFYCGSNAITHRNPLFVADRLINGNSPVKAVHYADSYNGFIYVSVTHENGQTRHHYLDNASNTLVTDAKCPHSKAVLKLNSKMFAVGEKGDTVRYCATGKCRDWSASRDAGFLPTGLNSTGAKEANALGIYKNNLVVMTRDSAQIWKTDPDPNAMGLIDRVENVGTSFPKTVATVAGDLYFLSDYGFRSITTLAYTDNLADVDIGSPIDTLVRSTLKETDSEPQAFYFYGTGQYVCCLGKHLFVYSLSRTSRISAWSQYLLNENVEAVAQLGQDLYIRCGDEVFKLDGEAATDDGEPFEVFIEIPYMDLKRPGELKRIYGVDVVCEGECEISVGYDERNRDAYTPGILVSGNTRPGGLIPIEVMGTAFSFRIRNFTDKPFRLDAITIYFDSLGPL